MHNFAPDLRKDARVVEEARLESVYTPKAYRGFESPSFRKKKDFEKTLKVFFVFYNTAANTGTFTSISNKCRPAANGPSEHFRTKALYGQYKGLVVFVQRPCSLRTKAL